MLPYRMEPTAERFHRDRTSTVKGLFGPVGTGKTVATCVAEPVYVALEQTPWRHKVTVPIGRSRRVLDGNIHHIRVAIMRKHYERLQRSVIKTMKQWFDPDEFEVRQGTSLTGALCMELEPLKDDPEVKRYIFIEYDFIPMDREDVYDKLASYEPTLLVLSELSEMERKVLIASVKRLGRFPNFFQSDPSKGPGPNRSQVIFDTNPPSEESWMYEQFEAECPVSYRIYKQPGAFIRSENKLGEVTYAPNPKADNVRNIKKGYQYWKDIIDAGDEDEIKRNVLGEYGRRLSGEPVFPVFIKKQDQLIADRELIPMPNQPVLIGMDLETRAAAVVGQRLPTGRLAVMGIAWPGEHGLQMPFTDFLSDWLVPLLNSRFPWRQWHAKLDPSGDKMQSLTDDDFKSACNKHGIAAEYLPAAANRIQYRIAHTNNQLANQGVILCPVHAKLLKKALAGKYRYNYVQGTSRRKASPEKDAWADLADSFQYFGMHNAQVVDETAFKKGTKVPFVPGRSAIGGVHRR